MLAFQATEKVLVVIPFFGFDGSLWGYTNWGPGQPNNLNGTQDFVAFIGPYEDGKWDDVGGPSRVFILFVKNHSKSCADIRIKKLYTTKK